MLTKSICILIVALVIVIFVYPAEAGYKVNPVATLSTYFSHACLRKPGSVLVGHLSRTIVANRLERLIDKRRVGTRMPFISLQ